MNYEKFEDVDSNEAKGAETCSICYQWVFQAQIVVINSHKHDICISCFEKFLNVQIKQSQITKLTCPHCDQSLTENVISQYAPKIYEKYLRFVKNQEIATNPMKAWCPSIGCTNVIEFKQYQSTEVCIICKTEVCQQCKQKAHLPQTCEENLQQQLQEWQLNRDIQQCPKCKYLVEKIGGCNHMTCQYCAHEWCWICGSDYTSIHYLIFNPFGCPALILERTRSKDWGYPKLLLWRLFCFFLFLILTPVAVIAISPVLCIVIVTHTQEFQDLSIQIKIIIIFIALLFGIFLIPISIIVCIILLIPAVAFTIKFYFDERRQLEARYQNALLKHSQLNNL